MSGLLKACEKRPVTLKAREAIGDEGVSMLQEAPDKVLTTSRTGTFQSVLQAGSYDLTVASFGYKTQTATVTITTGCSSAAWARRPITRRCSSS